jgi:hypothetical protein
MELLRAFDDSSPLVRREAIFALYLLVRPSWPGYFHKNPATSMRIFLSTEVSDNPASEMMTGWLEPRRQARFPRDTVRNPLDQI